MPTFKGHRFHKPQVPGWIKKEFGSKKEGVQPIDSYDLESAMFPLGAALLTMGSLSSAAAFLMLATPLTAIPGALALPVTVPVAAVGGGAMALSMMMD